MDTPSPAPINADSIAHVVTDGSTHHTLYLRDGLVVRINPTTGEIASVAHLPSREHIEEKLNTPRAPGISFPPSRV